MGKGAETRPESPPVHSPCSALPGLVGLRDPAASPAKVLEVSWGYVRGALTHQMKMDSVNRSRRKACGLFHTTAQALRTAESSSHHLTMVCIRSFRDP